MEIKLKLSLNTQNLLGELIRGLNEEKQEIKTQNYHQISRQLLDQTNKNKQPIQTFEQLVLKNNDNKISPKPTIMQTAPSRDKITPSTIESNYIKCLFKKLKVIIFIYLCIQKNILHICSYSALKQRRTLNYIHRMIIDQQTYI